MRTVKQSWKTVALAAVAAVFMAAPSQAAVQDVMCIKTNTGNYFPILRVSMMVVPDGANTFDIVLKENEGQGEAGVTSISFEKQKMEFDYSKYMQNSDGTSYIDMNKPVFLYTNTGKYWLVKDLPVMNIQEGTSLIDITVGSDQEKGVSNVFFFRGPEADMQAIGTGIEAPMLPIATERLQLMTPIREQMQVSGCGNATEAVVYSLDGKEMTKAPVANGVTTVTVGQLPAGVYVLRVGHKALKFMKK